jgi:predicted O-methyltransferase YrrM
VRPGGVLAMDNVLSHPDEVAPVRALLGPFFTGETVAVGKGLYLAVKKLTASVSDKSVSTGS